MEKVPLNDASEGQQLIGSNWVFKE